MDIELTWHSDPGHAWLEVDREMLDRLGLAERISSYSYEGALGSKVYLEEDVDAGILIRELLRLGYTLGYTDKSSAHKSWVRNLNRFKP